MAFEVTADEYSVLSMGGAFNFVSEDSLNTQSFVFQVAANNTLYPSVTIAIIILVVFQ